MQSFRTELENPLVEQDILDLDRKIRLFRQNRMPEDKFKSLRLARGIYGQRQPGVQMVRIKLPYGRLTTAQLRRIADISDEYSTGNLHLTTRQDIQIHFVSLDKTPELWAKLELDQITIREACGNTVRNITASPTAGIDPEEPFDITPYAQALFAYFLRNPVCQEMGRKFKIAFSSSDRDSAFTFMHDLGLIPQVQASEQGEIRGFRVLVGGGLGAQPFHALVAHEFLPAEDLIPYCEAVLRVFDRFGERSSRHKARIKYLIDKIGLELFGELVAREMPGIVSREKTFDFSEPESHYLPLNRNLPAFSIQDPRKFEAWRRTNLYIQKQAGFFGAYIRVPNGNISSGSARLLAGTVDLIAAPDLRVTINQDLLVRFLSEASIPYFYSVLEQLDLDAPGFDSVADITSCPGTDTCNLGISNSTGIARMLEQIIEQEYPQLMFNTDIRIKISGCMNSCGQHGLASIGFHGSSLKAGNRVLPALQVLLGGGVQGGGKGRMSEKIIKVPSRRAPKALRILLDDYLGHARESELFGDYYDRQGRDYFYRLLKPLADLGSLEAGDFIDWGQQQDYSPAIGVGECAGVMIDLISTLLFEADEKMEWAHQSLHGEHFADAIYHAYAAMISAAKALLLGKEIPCNSHNRIIEDFDTHFAPQDFGLESSFSSTVLQLSQNIPDKLFAQSYLEQADRFLSHSRSIRKNLVENSFP